MDLGRTAARASFVLIAHGSAALRTMLSERIERPLRRIHHAGSGESAWRAFAASGPDLVVAGTRLSGGGGIALARRIRAASAVPILLVADHVDAETALEALRVGASDLLRVPGEIDRVDRRVGELLPEARPPLPTEAVLVGASAAMREVRLRVQALANLAVAVAIAGEPGTGRWLVARALHALGSRGAERLARVTPADAESPAPEAGIIVLDRIDEFSLRGQQAWKARLRAVAAPGAPPLPRLVATSTHRLDVLAANGALDRELAAHFSTYEIRLPPLRDRLGDLADLVPFLLRRAGAAIGRSQLRISRAAIDRLRREPWPGNVRELTGVVMRLAAFARPGVVDLDRVETVLADRADLVSSLRAQREAARREELRRLLSECGGNFAEVARRLDLTRGAVVHRAKRFGLFDARRSLRRAPGIATADED